MKQLAPICCLLVLFTILNRGLLSPWRLTEDAYRHPVIFLSTLVQLLQPSIRSVLVAGIVLLLCFRYKLLWFCWSVFPDGRRIRIIVGVCACLLSWIYSTYDYNHFFAHGHLIDRALLVALSLAILWRPVFVLPFLLVLWPMVGQFDVPIGGLSWAIPFLPARILLLFAASLLLGLINGKWQTFSFMFLLLCIVAGHYLPAGLGKLEIGWFVHDQLYYLLPTTYANGWLGFLEPSTIDSITRLQSYANWPLKLLTIVAECGSVFFLWRHQTIKWFLGVWIAFHVGIFFTSGICFWPWVVVDLTLLLLVWKQPLWGPNQFGRLHFVLSVLLIATSSF